MSTVTVSAADAALVWPELLVAVAVRTCLPSASAEVVSVQAPVELAVAVPIWVEPSYTLMVLLAAAVPFSVSTLASVTPSPTTPVSGDHDVITGAAGADVVVVDAVVVVAVVVVVVVVAVAASLAGVLSVASTVTPSLTLPV